MTLASVLSRISSAFARLPENRHAWTCTITGSSDEPHITRTLSSRVFGYRVLLHRIHGPDPDPHLHSHPWKSASFLIVSGGYTEERLEHGVRMRRTYLPGDVNRITTSTFHRIIEVEPDTWTLGLVGPCVQDWGFLVGGAVIPQPEYVEWRRRAS